MFGVLFRKKGIINDDMKRQNSSFLMKAVLPISILSSANQQFLSKFMISRYAVNDYTLPWNKGRELRNMTVGIIGTGRIGRTVMKQISGFGCKIIAYDKAVQY